MPLTPNGLHSLSYPYVFCPLRQIYEYLANKLTYIVGLLKIVVEKENNKTDQAENYLLCLDLFQIDRYIKYSFRVDR